MHDRSPSPTKLTDIERLNRLRLIRSDNVGPRTFASLLRHFGDAAHALERLPDLARRGGGSGPQRICSEADATAELAACRRFGIPRWPFRERHRHTARLKHGDTEDVEPGNANDEVAGQSMDMDSGEMEASSASPESPRQSSRLLVAGANQSADCCQAAGKIKLHEGDSCPGGPGVPGGPMGVASAYPEAQP